MEGDGSFWASGGHYPKRNSEEVLRPHWVAPQGSVMHPCPVRTQYLGLAGRVLLSRWML